MNETKKPSRFLTIPKAARELLMAAPETQRRQMIDENLTDDEILAALSGEAASSRSGGKTAEAIGK